ncbi:MAG: helix-hairpin-helix domain-containing protein [Phycisphaerae bacterium]|nr:helix-hairpin-helix domain-containing protein [Phycisphaerae bacterium]
MALGSYPRRFDRNWLGRPETHWLCYGAILAGFLTAWAAGRPSTIRVNTHSSGLAPLSEVRARINPNTADWRALASLPGLGETLSKRIVAYRQAQRDERRDPGAVVFRTPQDLEGVKGIGPKRAAALSKLVVFSD